jgi:hypothetical protein
MVREDWIEEVNFQSRETPMPSAIDEQHSFGEQSWST